MEQHSFSPEPLNGEDKPHPTLRAAEAEEEEEEEEPRLKYQRLGPAGSDVAEILANDVASCFCVSERLLAIGMHSGSVYLLSCAGDKIKHFQQHKQAVKDLCFDETPEFVASCSDDGTAVVYDLYKDESSTYSYARPLKTIALDPRYGSRKTREFVTGGVAGKLALNSRGWLGNKDHALHAGEGPIHTARWSGNYIAWANDVCVKVYDSSLHKDVGSLERPKGTFPSPATECRLFWGPDHLLLIGWAHAVTVASVNGAELGAMSPNSDIQVVAKFDLDGIISGISLFSKDLAVLVYVTKEEENNHSRMRPELRILNLQEEEISSDALSIPGFEQYEANDYCLSTFYPTGGVDSSTSSGRHFSQWWPDGQEPFYYVVSPKDVVVGKPRDENDRVKWLLQHEKYSKALSVARALRNRDSETWEQVVDIYMKNLFKNESYAEAAAQCPDLLSGDTHRWERYLFLFAEKRQLDALSEYIPTENPTLKPSAYNMVLRACIPFPTSHKRLLSLVSNWPPGVYTVESLAREVLQRLLVIRGDRSVLKEVLAKLYILQGKYSDALEMYIELRRPEVFEFIMQHALLGVLTGKYTALILLDEKRALELLCANAEEANPAHVVSEIEAAISKCREKGDAKKEAEWKKIMFDYIHQLVSVNLVAIPDHLHNLLVQLYAEHDQNCLLPFLRVSHQYSLDQAYEICKTQGLVKEQVYILSRMGNIHDALQLIIKVLGDIPQAIDFAKNQNDNELWDSLIDWAVGSADTTGDLLDHVGGHVDPLRVITRIPHGMNIANLRQKLCQIIHDYRIQTSLQEGCNNILNTDAVHLSEKLYKEVRQAINTVFMSVGPQEAPTSWFSFTTSEPDLVPCREPHLDCIQAVEDVTASKQAYTGRDPVVKLAFLREESSGENGISSERFKLFRKATTNRYTGRKKEMPSLVQ